MLDLCVIADGLRLVVRGDIYALERWARDRDGLMHAAVALAVTLCVLTCVPRETLACAREKNTFH